VTTRPGERKSIEQLTTEANEALAKLTAASTAMVASRAEFMTARSKYVSDVNAYYMARREVDFTRNAIDKFHMEQRIDDRDPGPRESL
jgi:hypothetical protein